ARRRARTPCVIGERAAPERPTPVVPVRIQQVPAPLPDVAEHVEEPVQIGQLPADVLRGAHTIGAGPGDLSERPIVWTGRAGAAGVLPFLLGGEPISVAVCVPRGILAVER